MAKETVRYADKLLTQEYTVRDYYHGYVRRALQSDVVEHCRRVGIIAGELATVHGFDEKRVRRITIAGVLHDAGKINTPLEILNAPRRLTGREGGIIALHPRDSDRFAREAHVHWTITEAVRHHHERHDGSGYPDKLQADELTLMAGIIALADVTDALGEDRVYRPGWDRRRIFDYIDARWGTSFLPQLRETYLNWANEHVIDEPRRVLIEA